ncbi:hypothetical protein [Sphingopyxis sp.]|uniref:hypothetical protein n=1 Tax=Sphingopyxis sp. TaxID=1908224 RepID=UPI002D7A308A|nr:hypothetical protein [Sphingopyxis sp.]HET6523182.1 hypothetical protein [Sphingopyxis sp.]
MMVRPTGITISFGGTGGADDSRPVVARIFGFAGDAGTTVSHEMVVPAGKSVEQKLEQGLYNVELTLPSGRIIQRHVKIGEDTHEDFQFFEDFAPAGGFSLQESVGRPDREILAEAAVSSGNSSSEDYKAALDLAANRARSAPLTRGFKSRGHPAATSSTPAVALPSLAAVSQRVGSFDLAAESADSPDWESIEPADRSGDSALWRIPSADAVNYQPETRRWARIELPNGGVEIASLPLPWLCAANREYSPAELLVDPARSGAAATSVAVRDQRLAGLLAFLDRGQASSAAPILAELARDQMIEETIFAKMINPLAACAAAYVGLAVNPPGAQEKWDLWLNNCMTRFPGIPDAAIVHARRLVLRPTDANDNDRAAEALRAACAAGIPYFSAGALLLREMLLQLSADHDDLAPLAEKAGRLVGRLDAGQAFTVLRYAPEKAAIR